MSRPRRALRAGFGRSGTVNGWWERGVCGGCGARDRPVTWVGPPAQGGPYRPVLVCAGCLPDIRLIPVPGPAPATRRTTGTTGSVPAYRLPRAPDDEAVRALRWAVGGCVALLPLLAAALAVTLWRTV
ncbi:hypothetical protein ACGFX7_21360 [Streptomyces harbinensis]|uniref:hypothetical protein n=1 Tax=Streptomyces harbinensis TaxID=1176198 RepID=UPI003723B6D0